MSENKIDYTGRDYDSILAQLFAKRNEKLPDYTETSENDLGVMLMELFAMMGDMQSYYIDRIYGEAFLSECRERASALRLSRLIGYVPSTRQTAATDVIFSLGSNPSGTTIPRGDTVATVAVVGETRKVYTLMSDLIISAMTLSGTGSCSFGELVVDTFSGTGASTQTYRLVNGRIVSGSVEVLVDAVAWSEVQNLADKVDTDEVYMVLYNEDDTAAVIFGDGVHGKIPALASAIEIEYLSGGGVEGRVGANKLTRYLGSVSNVTSVTNQYASSGGADKEGLASVKVNAPASLKSAGRAVTSADYETIALAVSGVQQAKAIGYGGFVRVSIVPVGGGMPNATLKNNVSAALATKRPASTPVVIEDPVYINVDVSLVVVGRPGFKQSILQTRVENALAAVMNPNQTQDGVFVNGYGVDVFLSEIYQVVMSVEGVDRLTISTLKKSTDASGLGDVDLRANEIRSAGTVTVTVFGGSSDAQYEDQVRKVRGKEIR